MVNFQERITEPLAEGATNSALSPPESLAAATERISRGICLAPFVSHRNYNSQGEQGSDRELRHQGQRSHLEVTFQSAPQMLPIYLSPSPAPFPVPQPPSPNHPPPSPPSPPSCFKLPFSFCCLYLSPPSLHLPPPTQSLFSLHTPSPTL